MTIGQRIAEKRRQRGLSQEALGEALGVTRQSISKWEGDGALPEIDKLVAMSRLFGVSVGWLLGEETGEQREAAELSEQQVRLVGEIVSHYLSAQERTAGRRRRRLSWLAAGAAAVCLTAALVGLAGQLRRVEEQSRSLGATVDAIAGGVERMTAEEPEIRVDGIPMIVKGENEVTADFDVWDTAIDSTDFTLTFYAYAIPKNYVEGMEAIFTADSGDGPVEVVGTLRPGRKFEAEVTCERTDDIKLFVAFRYPDGSEERQMLGQMSMARTASFGDVVLDRNGEIRGMELHPAEDPEWVFIPAQATYVHPQRLYTPNFTVKKVWLGLFKNRELAAWCTPVDPSETRGTYFNVAEYPDIYGDCFFFQQEQMAVDFAEGDTLCYALIVHSDFNEEHNGYGTIDVRYGEVYDYNDIAGLPKEGVVMPADLGYEQYAWLETWGLTKEDLEKAPGHETPVSKENPGLSTSG